MYRCMECDTWACEGKQGLDVESSMCFLAVNKLKQNQQITGMYMDGQIKQILNTQLQYKSDTDTQEPSVLFRHGWSMW